MTTKQLNSSSITNLIADAKIAGVPVYLNWHQTPDGIWANTIRIPGVIGATVITATLGGYAQDEANRLGVEVRVG